MAVYYLDTSALVKRYALEKGTAGILRLADREAGHDLYTVRLTGPEMIAALYRKARTGDVPLAEAARSAGNFRADWQEQYQIVEVSPELTERAMNLAEQHGLRGYDSVHLAAALALQQIRQDMGLAPLTFLSADDSQLRAAGAEGMLVENPNTYP